MLYSKNTKVKLKGSEIIKLIVDSESIVGTNIYYMSDKTSYAEHQVDFTISAEYEYLMSKMTPEFVIENLIDAKKIGESMSKWYHKQKEKQNEKIINTTTPTRTSRLRKVLSNILRLKW